MPSDPPAPAGSALKRARASPDPAGPAKRAKANPSPKKKRRGQTGAEQHRMLRVSIPAKARELVSAFQTHVRLIWGVIAVSDVPVLPEDGEVAGFGQLFTSFDDVLTMRNNPNAEMPSNHDMVARLVELQAKHTGSGTNAQRVSRVREPALLYILGQLAKYGLHSWRPNFNEDAYSLYNSAHRFFAIDTYRQLAASMCYDFMGIDKSCLNDTLLLTRVYDHFVHHYMYNKWRKEQKYPGTAVEEADRNAILARRSKLAKKRAKTARGRRHPERMVKLAGNIEGTSDDELATEKLSDGTEVEVFHRRKKVGRSSLAEEYVRYLDKVEEDHQAQKKGKGKAKRAHVRKEHPSGKESEEALPTDVAMDYFDPDYFNQLEFNFRAEFAEKQLIIALPDDIDEIKKLSTAKPRPVWVKYGNGKDKEWMEKYGNDKLALYDIPPAGDATPDTTDDEMQVENIVINAEDGNRQEQFAAQAAGAMGPLLLLPAPPAAPPAASAAPPPPPPPPPAPPAPPRPIAGTIRNTGNASRSGSGSGGSTKGSGGGKERSGGHGAPSSRGRGAPGAPSGRGTRGPVIPFRGGGPSHRSTPPSVGTLAE